jgi:hypothetical protein
MPVRKLCFELHDEFFDHARNHLFGRNPGNVWEVDRVAAGAIEQTSHIAVFPEEISDRIVLSCSRVEEICLDPFSGSGTLCKIAKSRGREFIGFEISPEYHADSLRRLGFTPRGEFLNILSEMIKENYLEKPRQDMAIMEIEKKFAALLEGDEAKLFSAPVGEKIGKAILAEKIGGVEKKEKRRIWRELFNYFEECNEDSAIKLVDRAFLRAYKLHKRFNEVRRFQKAVLWLKELEINLLRGDFAEEIGSLADEEPLSFRRRGGKLALLSLEKRIK